LGFCRGFSVFFIAYDSESDEEEESNPEEEDDEDYCFLFC